MSNMPVTTEALGRHTFARAADGNNCPGVSFIIKNIYLSEEPDRNRRYCESGARDWKGRDRQDIPSDTEVITPLDLQ